MMKRLLLVAALSLVLAGMAVAATVSYSATASYGKPFDVVFTTSVAGPVSVEAVWTPKPKVRYVLTVKHLLNSADTYSYDQICQVYEPLNGSGSGQIVGDYTCSFPAGKAGYWTAEFRPLSGKVDVSLTISTP